MQWCGHLRKVIKLVEEKRHRGIKQWRGYLRKIIRIVEEKIAWKKLFLQPEMPER